MYVVWTAEERQRSPKQIYEYICQSEDRSDSVEALAASDLRFGRPKGARGAQNQYLSTHVNWKTEVICSRLLRPRICGLDDRTAPEEPQINI